MKTQPLYHVSGSNTLWLLGTAAWLLFEFVLLAQANPPPTLPPAVVPASLDTHFPPALVIGDVKTLLRQPDGNIIAGGEFHTTGVLLRQRLARFHPDGSVDPGFQATVNSVYALALEPGGGILIGGEFNSVNGQPRGCLARLLSNGALDLSFDPTSAATGGDPEVDAIALQPDGRILIGGSFTAIGGQPRECLARLNGDGSVDTGFVPSAGLLDDERSYVMALLLQEGNRVIVGGQALGSYSGVNVGGLFRIHLAEMNLAPTLVSQPVSQTRFVGQTPRSRPKPSAHHR